MRMFFFSSANVNFPTTVFSRKGYDARIERAHNTKDVLFAYHSSGKENTTVVCSVYCLQTTSVKS